MTEGNEPDRKALITEVLAERVMEWIRHEGDARSTMAGAIVVLDRLIVTCPLTDADVFTGGGQLVGGRGQALLNVLQKHDIPEAFLRDGVTTRSTEKFRRLLQALEYGAPLVKPQNWTQAERAALVARLVTLIRERIANWFARQHLKVACDRRYAPLAWVEEILEVARERSGGRVEQHLVGAKLELRFPDQRATIGRQAATAGDAQTGRPADFQTRRSVYHVTAAPSSGVINRCVENIREGRHPILLVPRAALERAKGLAEDRQIEREMTILAVEDFIAHNIVELAEQRNAEFLDMLRELIRIYNDRIQEAEIDKSLRIEIQ